MQRIDENTYIDDTLITCAEYQLFIDEMREQRKYYQPDHWTAYQFPSGLAKEPILGVRHTDATVFCEWLTRKNGDEWNFRLFRQEEAYEFLLKPFGSAPLGYWLIDADLFVWIKSVFEDGHTIDHVCGFNYELNSALERACEDDQYLIKNNRAIILARELTNARNSAREFASTGIRARHLVRVREHANASIRNITYELSRDLNKALEQAHASAHNSAISITGNIKHEYVRFLTDAIEKAISLAHDLADCLNSDLNLVRAHTHVNIADNEHVRASIIPRAIELAMNIGSELNRAGINARANDRTRNLGSDYKRDRDRSNAMAIAVALNIALNIYLDLFTIQERIVGRSPAFEGIRLVKERRR